MVSNSFYRVVPLLAGETDSLNFLLLLLSNSHFSVCIAVLKTHCMFCLGQGILPPKFSGISGVEILGESDRGPFHSGRCFQALPPPKHTPCPNGGHLTPGIMRIYTFSWARVTRSHSTQESADTAVRAVTHSEAVDVTRLNDFDLARG